VRCTGVYGEYGAGGLNVKEEYSDPSEDYSSDACSDLDWTSRSTAGPAGLTDVRYGILLSFYHFIITVI